MEDGASSTSKHNRHEQINEEGGQDGTGGSLGNRDAWLRQIAGHIGTCKSYHTMCRRGEAITTTLTCQDARGGREENAEDSEKRLFPEVRRPGRRQGRLGVTVHPNWGVARCISFLVLFHRGVVVVRLAHSQARLVCGIELPPRESDVRLRCPNGAHEEGDQSQEQQQHKHHNAPHNEFDSDGREPHDQDESTESNHLWVPRPVAHKMVAFREQMKDLCDECRVVCLGFRGFV